MSVPVGGRSSSEHVCNVSNDHHQMSVAGGLGTQVPCPGYGVFLLPDSYADSYSDSYSDIMQKGSTGMMVQMVIPMQSYYENYLKTIVSVPISVSYWVQYPSTSEQELE